MRTWKWYTVQSQVPFISRSGCPPVFSDLERWMGRAVVEDTQMNTMATTDVSLFATLGGKYHILPSTTALAYVGFFS